MAKGNGNEGVPKNRYKPKKKPNILQFLVDATYASARNLSINAQHRLERNIVQASVVKADGALNDILDKQLMRTVVQMKHWRLSLTSWEDYFSPDRSYMHQIYQEVALDNQVAAKMGIAHNRIEASEFFFVDPITGDEDIELTNKFRKEWFSKFLKESLNSDYYGYTLFQFPELSGDFAFDSNRLEVIPRHLVLPNVKTVQSGNNKAVRRVVTQKDEIVGIKDGLILPRSGAVSGVSFKHGKYAKRTLGIGEEDSLGMFASLSPLFIYKKNALQYWSGYQQRYGEPTMAINMNTWNKKNHQNYQNFLKNRGTNSGLILRNEDQATMLEANRHDAYQIYLQMITYSDGGISKVMEGNTMTSDTGGSKNTGDTHAATGELFHLGRLKRLAYHVNDHLVPFLEENYGMSMNGKVFRWKEFKDVDAEVENISKLAASFKIDAKEVFKRTGYQVEKMLEKENLDGRASNSKTGTDKTTNTKKKRN